MHNPNSLTKNECKNKSSGKKRKRKGYSKLGDQTKSNDDDDDLSFAKRKKQGWLDKQSRHKKVWKRRWCILKGLELTTYRDKKDDSGNVFDDINTPTVTIDLSKCQSCEYTDDLCEKQPYVFYLQCGALERYLFKAASQIERLEWMLAIRRMMREKQRSDVQKLIQKDSTEYARILALQNGYTSRILKLNQEINAKTQNQGNPNLPEAGSDTAVTKSIKSTPTYETTKEVENENPTPGEVLVEDEHRPGQCCLLL